jgi:hypothetical protein
MEEAEIAVAERGGDSSSEAVGVWASDAPLNPY